MLTPRFELDQDDSFLIVTIYAPFTNISDTEIFMDDFDFRFFSKPYFLRLHLPRPIEETDLAKAEYKADNNSFVIKAPKKTLGEFFPGLDMLSELLKPKGGANFQEPIEEFDENGELLEDIDCYFEQKIQEGSSEEITTSSSSGNKYGFGFSRSNVFSRLLDECQEILHVKDLDNKSVSERRRERIELEEKAFSQDHYLADTYDTNDELNSIITQKSKWEDAIELSTEDKQRMITLGTQKKCNTKVEKENILSASLGLLDILFAYCYDFRTTEGEHSSESAWTMSTLCATLSCGERYANTEECVITCVRRSLCYPLYRNWKLSLVVWNDVCKLLKNSGKKGILQILLRLIPVFLSSEGYYLYNQMYIEDYALWCQSLSDKLISKLAKSLQNCIDELIKEKIGLDIEKLEAYATEVILSQKFEKEAQTEVDLLQQIAELNINNDKVDSDDSDDEGQSSSSDTSQSSSDVESDSTENDTSSDSSCRVNDEASKPNQTLNSDNTISK